MKCIISYTPLDTTVTLAPLSAPLLSSPRASVWLSPRLNGDDDVDAVVAAADNVAVAPA